MAVTTDDDTRLLHAAAARVRSAADMPVGYSSWDRHTTRAVADLLGAAAEIQERPDTARVARDRDVLLWHARRLAHLIDPDKPPVYLPAEPAVVAHFKTGTDAAPRKDST